VIGADVAVIQLAPEGILDGTGRGADVAVVKVDDVAIHGEGIADLGPIIFVGGYVFRSPAAGGSGGGADTVESVVLECNGGGRRQNGLNHMTTVHNAQVYSKVRPEAGLRPGVFGLIQAQLPSAR
jgi:hypothetical protein